MLLSAWEPRRCWLAVRLVLVTVPSAAAINCSDLDTSELRQLLNELGSMPVLLYGTAPPSYVSGRAPFLATSKPTHPEAIVKAVAGFLSS